MSSNIECCVENLVKGTKERVLTRYGCVTVTLCGDRSKTPCVTYHDVGLNHESCFTSLLVCSATRSLLSHNMCFYHIDAPGSENGNDSIPQEILPLTLEKLAAQVEDVIRHYDLPQCIGMGVGAGGYVMTLLAVNYPKSVFALVLLSPACTQASWWEWSFGSVALWHMRFRGLHGFALDHLVDRLVSGRSAELMLTLKKAIGRMSPSAVGHYFAAVLSRPDLTSKLKKLQTERILLLWGYEALYKTDSCEMNRELMQRRDRVGWSEMDGCGVLLTEESPFRILDEMSFFVRALQTRGYCLDWKIEQ